MAYSTVFIKKIRQISLESVKLPLIIIYSLFRRIYQKDSPNIFGFRRTSRVSQAQKKRKTLTNEQKQKMCIKNI